MILVKKQGPFEVFSRGVEEPWTVWRDGQPYRQVWTWKEVDEILRETVVPKASHHHATTKKTEVVLAKRNRPRAGVGEPRHYATLVDKDSGRHVYRSPVKGTPEEAAGLAEAFAARRGLTIAGRV